MLVDDDDDDDSDNALAWLPTADFLLRASTWGI